MPVKMPACRQLVELSAAERPRLGPSGRPAELAGAAATRDPDQKPILTEEQRRALIKRANRRADLIASSVVILFFGTLLAALAASFISFSWQWIVSGFVMGALLGASSSIQQWINEKTEDQPPKNRHAEALVALTRRADRARQLKAAPSKRDRRN
jgi:hypothetical protein